MSRVNTESFLRLPESSSLPSVRPGSPDFTPTQVVGGSVQIGAPKQQIGPSEEEALFASLAQIATGVQKGIDVFSDIRTQIEKKTIDEAKLKFKSIYSGDYTEVKDQQGNVVKQYNNPEEKMDEWNKYIAEVWTPLLGDTWIRDLNIDAYSYFGNREAQNKFEEGRYQREWINYQKANQTRNPNDIRFKKDFDEVYLRKYPTANSNEWFNLNSLIHKGEFDSQNEQEAKQALDLAISYVVPIPTSEQIELVYTNSSEAPVIRDKFKVFFDLQNQTQNQTFENTQSFVENLLTEELITKNPYQYEENVLRELGRVLPTASRKYALELQNATFQARRYATKEAAGTAIQTQHSIFSEAKPQDLDLSFKRLLDTSLTQMPSLERTPMQEEEYWKSLGLHAWTTWNTSIENNRSDIPIPSFELNTWQDLTAYEKLDIIKGKLTAWLDTTTQETVQNNGKPYVVEVTNRTKLARLLRKPEDQVSSLLLSPNTLQSNKEFQAAVQQDQQIRQQQINSNIQTIGLIADVEKVESATKDTIQIISSRWGLSVGELKSLYFDDENKTLKTTGYDINTWFRGLNLDTQKKMLARGFTPYAPSPEFLTSITQAKAVDQAAISQLQNILKGDDAALKKQTQELERVVEISARYSSGFTPNAKATQGNWQLEVIRGGTIHKAENTALRDLVINMEENLNRVGNDEDPKTDIQKSARQWIQTHVSLFNNADFKFLFQAHTYAKTEFMIRGNDLIKTQSSYLVDPTSWTKEKQQEHLQKLEKAWTRLVKGEVPTLDGTIPDNLMNSEGEFTEDGYLFVIRSEMAGSRLLQGNEKDQKDFGFIVSKYLESLGNLADMEAVVNDRTKAPVLMAIAAMGRSYEKATEEGKLTFPGNAGYLVQRLFLLGNISDDLSYTSIANMFINPEAKTQTDASLSLMFGLAKEVSGTQQTQMQVESGGFGIAKTISIPEQNVQTLLSSIGAQLSEEDAAAIEAARQAGTYAKVESQNPNDDDWTSTQFVKSLKDLGFIDKSTTDDVLASVLQNTILKGIYDDSYPLDAQQTIKLAAQVLHEATRNETRPFLYALRIAKGPYGITEGGLFDPTPKKTTDEVVQNRATKFFQLIGTALDLDDALRVNPEFRQTGNPVSSTVFNSYYTQIGAGVLGKWRSIQGDSPQNGFTFLSPIIHEQQIKAQVLPEDIKLVTNDYQPDTYLRTQKNTDGEDTTVRIALDGLPFRAGVQVLERQVNDQTFMALIQPWLNANNFNVNLFFLKGNLSKDPAAVALKSVLGKPGTILDKLNELDETYRSLGGKVPLIDKDKFKKNSPGFATLVQNPYNYNIKKTSTLLPTWNWAKTDLVSGTPMIALSDAFWMSLEQEEIQFPNLVKKKEIEKRLNEIRQEEKARKELQQELLRKGPKI